MCQRSDFYLSFECSQAEALDVGYNSVSLLHPTKRLWCGVFGLNEGANIMPNFIHRAMNAKPDHPLRQKAESAFELIDPRSKVRLEMHVIVRALRQSISVKLDIVCRQVVEYQIYVELGCHRRPNVVQ